MNKKNSFIEVIRDMLTNALRTLVKDSKIEIIDKNFVEKKYFLLFQCIEYTISKIKFSL